MNRKKLRDILHEVFDDYSDMEDTIHLDTITQTSLIVDIIDKLYEYFELDEET
jgi:hypothetical protein